MKHTKKIIEFIANRDNEALQNWIASQPELDRAEIMREVVKLLQRLIDPKGFDPNNFKELEQLANSIDTFEDAILDRKLEDALKDIESNES